MNAMKTDDTPLANIEFVAFDLETTGLFAVSCQIVEIGAVRFRLGGTVIDTFEQLIDPRCEIAEEVTGVHGITNDMVQGKPTISQVLPRFVEFLGSPDRILLAHNAGFDVGFLGLAMARCGVEHPPHAIVDTLELAQKTLLGPRSYRLEDVAIFLGVADSEDHRGLSDSRMLVAVFRKIVAWAKQLRTVGDLSALCRPLSFEDGGAMLLEPPPGFEVLAAAIAEQRTVIIVYDGGSKGLGERRVTPRGLVRSGGRAYLNAYCHIDCREKNYRLDSIRQFRIEES
jgi:DNA polymerase-3 subunit epsilon